MGRRRHIGAACASDGFPPQIRVWNSWTNNRRLAVLALSTEVGQ